MPPASAPGLTASRCGIWLMAAFGVFEIVVVHPDNFQVALLEFIDHQEEVVCVE